MSKESQSPKKLQKMSPERLVHYDILKAIKQDDTKVLEALLQEYPENYKHLYPSLKSVEVKSFKTLQTIKRYYGPFFDVDLYSHIHLISLIKDPTEMKDCIDFFLDNGFRFMDEHGYGADSLTYFYDLVYSGLNTNHLVLIATKEILKGDHVCRTFINFKPDEHLSIQDLIMRCNPDFTSLHYYLDFVEECMKAGMLFPSGRTFKNTEIQRMVLKYPTTKTIVQTYNS